MAKCRQNNVDLLTLNRVPSASSSSSTSGNAFSGSALRRIIVDAISCGGSSRYRREIRENDEDKHYFTRSTVAMSDSKPVMIGGDYLASEGFVMKTEKLCDLLNLGKMESGNETKKKDESLEIMKQVVIDLKSEATTECGDDGEKKIAAASKVRLLAKADTEARVTLAMLGAIPPLVNMIDDSSIEDAQIASLYALLNLGIGNDANKEAIVKSGSIHKMLNLINSSKPPNQAITEAIIANFLALSALDSNKPIIGSSGAIIFLVKTLQNLDATSTSQAREDALRALYNLSIHPQNINYILETDLIPFLLTTLGDMEVSERILSILTNILSIPQGKKAIETSIDSIPILVDVLNWNDSQKCQEKAIYILMVMAHKGYQERKAMIEAGIDFFFLSSPY